jgi:hypothetical protein
MDLKESQLSLASTLTGAESVTGLQGGLNVQIPVNQMGLVSGLFATPQQYGATGNGTTDDTPSIQNAINANYGSK